MEREAENGIIPDRRPEAARAQTTQETGLVRGDWAGSLTLSLATLGTTCLLIWSNNSNHLFMLFFLECILTQLRHSTAHTENKCDSLSASQHLPPTPTLSASPHLKRGGRVSHTHGKGPQHPEPKPLWSITHMDPLCPRGRRH